MTRDELINSKEYKDAKNKMIEFNKDIDFVKKQLRYYMFSSVIQEDEHAKIIADYFYEKYVDGSEVIKQECPKCGKKWL